ncbi:hypothetical protein COOONC_24602 [Cooperia oncophora]
MSAVWLVGVFGLIVLPVAHTHTKVVDPFQEDLTYSGINIERMEGFMGRLHPVQCNHYKPLCHKFMKCFGNCEEFFIPAINQEDLTDEQKERAKTIKTNPCVAMFAYCLSVDYFQLAAVLDLTTPDAF